MAHRSKVTGVQAWRFARIRYRASHRVSKTNLVDCGECARQYTRRRTLAHSTPAMCGGLRAGDISAVFDIFAYFFTPYCRSTRVLQIPPFSAHLALPVWRSAPKTKIFLSKKFLQKMKLIFPLFCLAVEGDLLYCPRKFRRRRLLGTPPNSTPKILAIFPP